ncbi:MAG: glycosyltransferase family 2 protein [Bacillota bacterium]|nr:glycosyltransferase family 2 protein [Bacillota bacterium]
MHISAIIPAFNEEEYIGATITALKKANIIDEIIVVDDGSNDKTGEIANQFNIKLLQLPQNSGKGAALNYGASEATGDIICLLDADLGDSAIEVLKLISPIKTGTADVVIGRFPRKRKKAGFGLVKGLASWGIKSFTGLQFLEPLSGQRALTRAALLSLLPFADGFGVEVLLTIKALKKGFNVIEVDTNMTHQESGRNLPGFIHRGRQFTHVVRTLLKARGLRYE